MSARSPASQPEALRGNVAPALALSAAIALIVFGLEPARALAANWEQLSIDFGELARRIALPVGAAFVALSLAATLLVAVAGARGVALLTALLVGLWLQTSVLVWDYGPFDGRAIPWQALSAERALELAVWALLLGGAWWRAAWVRRRVGLIAAIVSALYLASFAEQIARFAPFPEREQASTPVAGLSLYSTSRNAIVIVLDTLQSDFFAELLLDPQFAATVPPGFTYYRNATSYYGSTQFSLQSILTSARVPDGVEAFDFTHEAMEESIPSRLGARDFDAALATFATGNMPGCKPPRGPYSCQRLEELLAPGAAVAWENVWRADVSELLRVALFRASPQVVKRRLRSRGGWRVPPLFAPSEFDDAVDPRIDEKTRTDLLTLERLTRELAVQDVPPRFRFLHLHTPHHPVSVDAQCRYAEVTGVLDLEREQALGASRCILSRVFDYLRVLDAEGGYDTSAIFIVADHGSQFPVKTSVARPPLPPAAGRGPGYDFTSRGVPLFLAKPPEARGPLQTSDRPVALCDVPNSVYSALGVPDRAGCESVFRRGPRTADRRYYRYPDYFEQSRRGLTAFEFEGYTVDGHAWQTESWRPLEPIAP